MSQSWQCFVDFQDQEKNFCLAPNGGRSLMVFSAVYGDGREVLVLGHDEQYLDGTEDCYVSCTNVRREGKDGVKYRWYGDPRCVFEHSNGSKEDAYKTGKAIVVDRTTTFG